MSTIKEHRINAVLNTLINYSNSGLGIMTQRAFIHHVKAVGGTVFTIQVRQHQKEEKEEAALFRLQGHIPSGNECHPQTIAYNKRKEALKGGFFKTEYRAQLPGTDSRNVITKIEYDYFHTL